MDRTLAVALAGGGWEVGSTTDGAGKSIGGELSGIWTAGAASAVFRYRCYVVVRNLACGPDPKENWNGERRRNRLRHQRESRAYNAR